MCEKDFDEQALEEEFNDAKKAYKSAREGQKNKIKEKFEDIKKSGNDSFGFLVKDVYDYDYADDNWFGINVKIGKDNDKDKEEKTYHIALQAYDKDQKSDNIHVLMDRLGVCEYDGSVPLSFDKITEMVNTNVDLPVYKYDLLFAAIEQTYKDDDKDFNDKRNNYIKVRREQQQFIAKTLEDLKNEGKSQFEVITPSKNENGYYNHTSGAGRPKYNNHKSIKEFNNSIWKWIEVVVRDKENSENIKDAFCISLQTFNNSGDAYVAFDKIGIYKYPSDMINAYNAAADGYKKQKLKTEDAINQTEPTEISLPIKKEGVKSIVEKLMSLMKGGQNEHIHNR